MPSKALVNDMTTRERSGAAVEIGELRGRFFEFAKRDLRPDVLRRDMDGTPSVKFWRAAADFGLQRLLVPSESHSADLLKVVTAMEAIGEGCEDGGFSLSIVAHAFGCAFPVHLAGTVDQKKSLLPKFRSGEIIGACAMTEEASGSDAFSMRTMATRDGSGYVLNGDKLYVTNGQCADVFLVYARNDERPGALSSTAFLVGRGTEGLEIEPGPEKLGVRTADWASLRLEGCRVTQAARIGAEGSGGALFREAMKWERMALSAASVGAMRASLDRCIEFVKGHERFGSKLSKFQAITHRLVDMRVRLEAGRSLLYQAVREQKNGSPREDLVAIAKLAIGEASFQNGYDEAHLRGAAGVSMDSGASLLMRNALALQSASGTQEVQRMFIANSMGLR